MNQYEREEPSRNYALQRGVIKRYMLHSNPVSVQISPIHHTSTINKFHHAKDRAKSIRSANDRYILDVEANDTKKIKIHWPQVPKTKVPCAQKIFGPAKNEKDGRKKDTNSNFLGQKFGNLGQSLGYQGPTCEASILGTWGHLFRLS